MTVASLEDFIRTRHEEPTRHLVIGNEAGDADSIVSALTLAYVDSLWSPKAQAPKTPILSIPRADLETQRPETMLLLKLAGISRETCQLLHFVDDPIMTQSSSETRDLTLVDHNRLADKLAQQSFNVVEIVDHHYDEGYHLDSCGARSIAFQDDKATVASTCTLVVERLQGWRQQPIPVSLGILLLGTILLDSVNMIPQADKGTPRDAEAIKTLLESVDWNSLDDSAKASLAVVEGGGGAPDTNALFDMLQAAKFDPAFWKSLSVRDALRLDYKRFGGEGTAFGASTVLSSVEDFLQKDAVAKSIDEYMNEVGVDFLAVMLTHVNEHGTHRRQLILCGYNRALVDDLVEFLVHETSDEKKKYDQDSLKLDERKLCPADATQVDQLLIRVFDQGNAKASRKQLAPILLQFFEGRNNSKL